MKDEFIQIIAGSNFTFCNTSANSDNLNGLKNNRKNLFYSFQGGIHLWEFGYVRSDRIVKDYARLGPYINREDADIDSSFVLYDELNDIVVAYRDMIGNFPVFYYHNPAAENNLRVFSFSRKSIQESRVFAAELNFAKIREYLQLDNCNAINDTTFLKHVFRLLPGHRMIVEKGRKKEMGAYGCLNVRQYDHFTDHEYLSRLKNLFLRSINLNISGARTIAGTLSGGLDSSSIACVVQSIRADRIFTFNFDTSTPEASEDIYIQEVSDKWKISHGTVPTSTSEYKSLQKIINQAGQPVYEFNTTNLTDLLESGFRAGADVFFTGHYGDAVISHGIQYLNELLSSKSYDSLKKAIDQLLKNSKYIVKELDPWNSIERQEMARIYAINLFFNDLRIKADWLNVPVAIYVLYRKFDCRPSSFIKYAARKFKSVQKRIVSTQSELLCEPAIKKSEEFCMALKWDPEDNAGLQLNTYELLHFNQIFRPASIYGREDYHEVYRQYNLWPMQPFFDRKLIELNLAIPLRLKFGEGLTRGSLRTALSEYLPEMIANRATKGEFSGYHLFHLVELSEDFIRLTPKEHPIWKIVVQKQFEHNLVILKDPAILMQKKVDLFRINERIIRLGIWLDYFENVLFGKMDGI